jgi:hypothetical protein
MVAADDVVDVVQDREDRHAGRRNQQPGSQLCAYRLHSCPGVHGSAPLSVKTPFPSRCAWALFLFDEQPSHVLPPDLERLDVEWLDATSLYGEDSDR